MKRVTAQLTVLLAALLLPVAAGADDDCLGCHRQKTPGAVTLWQGSAHAQAGVGCVSCHGNVHDKIRADRAVVDTKTCGQCHQQALEQHEASRHGMGLHSGWGCTRNQPDRDPDECRFCHEEGSTRPFSTVECSRFLTQSRAMRELGCNRCHQVENSCASCHGNHLTDLGIVRNPNVCAKCHMGPDHPQWEMWQTSQHGTLYTTAGETVGPTCQRCHMPQGTHNVSTGLSMAPGGTVYPDSDRAGKRATMLKVCADCHAAKFARRELERGDAIRSQSTELVREAEKIIWDLADRGLLDPMPENRPPHPLRGKTLVTDSQMLYEDTSHIERLFFKMKKYDFAQTVKGAFHQNPAYTHWYGNAELKMDLVDIRAEAARLIRQGEDRFSGTVGQEKKQDRSIEQQLQILKKKFERGAISQEAYTEAKKRLLDLSLKDGQGE